MKRLIIGGVILNGALSSLWLQIMTYTLRHLLGQPNNITNKWQGRYLRDLQPFVGTVTLAHHKGALSEVDTLRRRPDFVHQAILPLFFEQGERCSVGREQLTAEVPVVVRRRTFKLSDNSYVATEP
jgi:hypothetical protein